LDKFVNEGKLAFVDASPDPHTHIEETGAYDLSALLIRIGNAVKQVQAKLVVIDSLGSLFTQFSDAALIHRISASLLELGATVVLTAERLSEYGQVSRFGDH